MKINYRTKPYVILTYEALFRSLKNIYRENEVLNADYNRYLAGFRGEKNVDYKLSLYPHKDLFILQDLRIKIHHNYFQIDTLILTKKFFLILEIKNIGGELEYDPELRQLIQKKGEKEKGYKDPILQAEAQKSNLIAWLQKININSVPIETLAVVSNPSTIIRIKQGDPEIYNKLIHTESLHLHLDKLNEKYSQNVLNNASLKRISNLLLNENTPHHPNLIQQYNISKRHLIEGVPCNKCQHSPIDRLYKKWSCQKCSTSDYTGHDRIILDYFLLYKKTITNQECRELLRINSARSAYIILTAMNLKYTGKNSARKYHSPSLEDFPQDSSFPYKNKSILDFNNNAFIFNEN